MGWLPCGSIEGAEEGLEGGAIFSRGDQRGFFVALGFDGEELFGAGGGVVDGLAELERDYRVLGAVDDEDWGGGFVEAGGGGELAVDQEFDAGEEPGEFASQG